LRSKDRLDKLSFELLFNPKKRLKDGESYPNYYHC